MVQSHPPCVAFSGVIREQLRELKEFRSERHYERNQIIYSASDPADEIFVIESGRVKLIRLSPEGKEKIIDIYQPGDFFGELCICGGGLKREDQAVALEPVCTISFKVHALLSLLPNKPEMALDLLVLVCSRLSEYQSHIATLAFDLIPQRLAKELMRLSQSGASEPGNGGWHLGVNLTHEELAKLVGTSREIITTVMNQFRQQGLVDYSRRNIVVYSERVAEYLEKSRLQAS